MFCSHCFTKFHIVPYSSQNYSFEHFNLYILGSKYSPIIIRTSFFVK
jgi:hypothetical protein